MATKQPKKAAKKTAKKSTAKKPAKKATKKQTTKKTTTRQRSGGNVSQVVNVNVGAITTSRKKRTTKKRQPIKSIANTLDRLTFSQQLPSRELTRTELIRPNQQIRNQLIGQEAFEGPRNDFVIEDPELKLFDDLGDSASQVGEFNNGSITGSTHSLSTTFIPARIGRSQSVLEVLNPQTRSQVSGSSSRLSAVNDRRVIGNVGIIDPLGGVKFIDPLSSVSSGSRTFSGVSSKSSTQSQISIPPQRQITPTLPPKRDNATTAAAISKAFTEKKPAKIQNITKLSTLKKRQAAIRKRKEADAAAALKAAKKRARDAKKAAK